MIKKKLPGMSKKQQLQARAKNRLHNFMLENGQIRCHNCNTVYQFHKEEIEKFLKKSG